MKPSVTILCAALALAGCKKSRDEAGPAAEATPTASKATTEPEAPAEPPNVDALLARHFEALGGEDALRAAKTMTYSGISTEAGEKTRITIYRKRPGKFRYEIGEGDAMKLHAFDGTRGWHKAPGAEVETMPEEKSAKMKAKAEFDDPLLDHAEKGHRVTLRGRAEVKGAPAWELEMLLADGRKELRYLDASSYLETKRVVSYEHDGEQHEKAIYFGDYRTVDGMVINHRVETESSDGTTSEFVIDRMSFSAPIDDALFEAGAGV